MPIGDAYVYKTCSLFTGDTDGDYWTNPSFYLNILFTAGLTFIGDELLNDISVGLALSGANVILLDLIGDGDAGNSIFLILDSECFIFNII